MTRTFYIGAVGVKLVKASSEAVILSMMVFISKKTSETKRAYCFHVHQKTEWFKCFAWHSILGKANDFTHFQHMLTEYSRFSFGTHNVLTRIRHKRACCFLIKIHHWRKCGSGLFMHPIINLKLCAKHWKYYLPKVTLCNTHIVIKMTEKERKTSVWQNQVSIECETLNASHVQSVSMWHRKPFNRLKCDII